MIVKELIITHQEQNYTVLFHSGSCGCFTIKLNEQVLGNGRIDGKNISEYPPQAPQELREQILAEIKK